MNSFWTVSGNWSNNVPPVAGDNLIFPSGNLSNWTSTNDFPAGTAFGKITIFETTLQSCAIGGARIVLNGGIAFSGNQLSSGATVGCDLTLGANQSFISSRSLHLAGAIDLNGKVLTVDGTGGATFSGTVVNSGAYCWIVKTNAGFVNINSGSRVAVPEIDVDRGTLQVEGAVTNGSGTANVVVLATGGDTLNPPPRGSAVLAGDGTVDVAVVHDTLRPGFGGPGILNVNYLDLTGFGCGFLCGVPAGVLEVDLNGTTPGASYDQVSVYAYNLTQPQNGGTVYTSPTLDARVGYSAQIGDSYEIIRLLPGNPFNYTYYKGAFAGLPPDSVLDTTNGYSLGVSYPDSVVLTTLRRPDSPYALWKGSGAGSTYGTRLWSDTNNWTFGVQPGSGGGVQFTRYQFRDVIYGFGGIPIVGTPPPQTNDLSAGTSVGSLVFSDTNYVLYGNSLTVTEGITNHISTGTNSCFLDLVLAGSLVLDVDAGSTLVLGGSFNGGSTIQKEGDGELRYNGTTLNAFLGTVVVDHGALVVNGSLTDGAFAVNGGLLCGTGSVSSVTMNGGVLSPGLGPGILHVQGDVAMAPGAVFQVELNGGAAGTGYDQLQVNGAVALNGATLDLLPGYSATVGSVFLLVVNDGSDPVTGTFAGLPEGAVFSAAGQFFSISYHAGSGGNDVVLTRVNPPAVPGRFTSAGLLDSATIQFQGTGGSNVSYIVQANTNLATTNWINIGTAPSGTNGQFSFDDTNLLLFPSRFFRLKNP